MENQETQAEVVVEEQATTATATPAVEAAPAPEAAPAKKKKLNVGKGILVLVFFLLSFLHWNFSAYQQLFGLVNLVAVVVWFVGYCITAEKVGKIVRTVGVALMAIYWLSSVFENILLIMDEADEALAWVVVLVRTLLAVTMVVVLALTDWLPKARNAMNQLGNTLMLVLILLNVVATIFIALSLRAYFAIFDLVGYTFLALALKIAKSAVIEARE